MGRNMTLTVMVPVLTNTVALREGEQLRLEVVPKATSTKREVSTWRTDANMCKRGAVTAAVVAETGKRNTGSGRQKAECTPTWRCELD